MKSKARILALCVTLLIAASAVVGMLMLHLNFNPQALAENREWPPVDSSELLFADEFVVAGEVTAPEVTSEPAPVAESAPTPEATDMENAGEPAKEAPEVITSKQPAPIKVTEKKPKEKTGPTKAEIDAQEKAKREKETAQNISNRVNFGKPAAGGQGDGTPSEAGKESVTGARGGTATGKLGGRTLERWSKPSATATGSIVITVRVDREGRVTSASYSSGTGAVASLQAARRSCEQAALKSQFSVALDGPATQVGTITYRFK
ncbi:MAG: hypothetical protein NC043_01155 [Muribaculaceae bacterium]|nr:hypothetical protein [Muribaculaceae bacterium]